MDAGLEGVIAAETVLSKVDGERGELIIRGRMVGDIAAKASFEEAAHLLWNGFFDDLPPARDLAARMGRARVAAYERIADTDIATNPVTNLRLNWARLPDDETLDTAIQLAAAALCLSPRRCARI